MAGRATRSAAAGSAAPGPAATSTAATGVVGVHLTQRVMESPEPTAVFTDFWTGVRAAAGV